MRVDMHQRPVNYKTAARSFCKQTCFSRFYFWDRKLSCKVASLQWASLVYRPREANILADYLAGVVSRAAQALPAHVSEPTEIVVDAPFQLAMQSGAIVLEERPLGVTILLLTEVPNISMELVNKFMVQTANQQYLKEVEAYLAGTVNLTKSRVVEYTASATDCLG